MKEFYTSFLFQDETELIYDDIERFARHLLLVTENPGFIKILVFLVFSG